MTQAIRLTRIRIDGCRESGVGSRPLGPIVVYVRVGPTLHDHGRHGVLRDPVDGEAGHRDRDPIPLSASRGVELDQLGQTQIGAFGVSVDEARRDGGTESGAGEPGHDQGGHESADGQGAGAPPQKQ